MFGLFDSKSEKLVKKAYKIQRELLASHLRVLNNKTSEFWIKYCFETGENFMETLMEIKKECGNKYLQNLEKNLEFEAKNSKYQFSEDEIEQVQDLVYKYKMKNGIFRL